MSFNSIRQFVQFRAKNPHMMAEAARIFQVDCQNQKKLKKIQQKIRHHKQLLAVALQQRKRLQNSIHRQLARLAQEEHNVISKIQQVNLQTSNLNANTKQRNQAIRKRLNQNEEKVEHLQKQLQEQSQQNAQQIRKLNLQLNLESQRKRRYLQTIKEKKANIKQAAKLQTALQNKQREIIKMQESSVRLNNQNTFNRNKLKTILENYQISLKQKIEQQTKQKQQKQIQINQFIGDLNNLVGKNQIAGLKYIIQEFYEESSRQQIQDIKLPQETLENFKYQLKTSELQQVDLDEQNFKRNISLEMTKNQKIAADLDLKILKAKSHSQQKQDFIKTLRQKISRISHEADKVLSLKKK